ncbi:hypothetical protein CCR75_000847 [Bremia lactucae]|uniref:phosphatidate phosphatase n=1 Tax=Bremia lactucae TaxID=4779 RepID=A0A976FN86_BRELC|nr:hypothetical protein CCR75_000847 [Bremia lactucae]
MNVIYSVKDYVSNVFYQDSNSGAIDVVAVQQPDGTLRCSPFHVRFDEAKPMEKQQVRLEVNGKVVESVSMKLGSNGEAYFARHVELEKDELASPTTSPSSHRIHQDTYAASDALKPQDESESNDRSALEPDAFFSKLRNHDFADEYSSVTKSCTVMDIATNNASAWDDNLDCSHPSMSLCGHLLDQAKTKSDVHRIFFAHLVAFDNFRNHPEILKNSNLRFFVGDNIVPYDAAIQAYLVSRVLFPYSQHLRVDTSAANRMIYSSDSYSDHITNQTSNSSIAHSVSCGSTPSLEAEYENYSDDDNSTQDTASVTSEEYVEKSFVPSADEMRDMSLRIGMNEIAFVLQSHNQDEVARVSAKLYLWPVTAKLVIVQIDGAILSSAAYGRMFQRRDAAAMHPGAVEFYSKLARIGYHIVYVTYFGLSQATLLPTLVPQNTGDFGEPALPMGPVLLSPDRCPVNDRTEAQDFQKTALRDLSALFPREVNPFYAAFGTSSIHSTIFSQVGVFSGKVFLVDPSNGSLRHWTLMAFRESYASFLARLDTIFPPIQSLMPQDSDSCSSKQQQVVPHERIPRCIKATSCRFYNKIDLLPLVPSCSLSDEAYNDMNFWRLEPGQV